MFVYCSDYFIPAVSGHSTCNFDPNNFIIKDKHVTGRGGQQQEREGFKDFPKQFI